MKKRIFVAINFEDQIKDNLVTIQNKIDYQFIDINPIKWTKKQNLHLTLFFIGYVYDSDLVEIFNNVADSIKDFKSFEINFNKINYFPEDVYAKKMIWAFGEKNKNLERLNQELKKNILKTEKEAQPFSSHITLGRISAWEFKKINPEELPEIKESINLNLKVKKIDIMESELKKGGAQYTILKSFNLL